MACEPARIEGSERAQLRTLLLREGRRVGLPPIGIETFARKAVLSTWRSGQTILPTIDGHEAVHLLVSGVAKLAVCTPAGTRPLTLGYVRPGRFLGLSSLFDPPRPRAFRSQALSDCTVAALSHEGVAELVEALPPGAAFEVMANSWRVLSSVLHRKCRSLSAPPPIRLIAELRSLAVDFGTPHPNGCLIDLDLSSRDLAALTATSERTVVRLVERLHRERLVATEGKFLVLLAAEDDACLSCLADRPSH